MFLKQLQELRQLSADDLYRQFQDEMKTNFPHQSWTISIFEGSPAEGLYSWCPDCVVASTHIKHFEKLQKRIRLEKFKVGSRKEWENRTNKKNTNPFRANFPYLSDVPTAILFMKTLDVFRIIAPRESDLNEMCRRALIYEKQIRSGDWNPPLAMKAKGRAK